MSGIYYKRIVDKLLNLKLRAFGATNIVGPKWCGKTRTALEFSKSNILLQREINTNLKYSAQINPFILLDGEKPRLIDEWQDVPSVWDAVRSYCDEHHTKGNFILTGSTSQKVETSHTGTGRISELMMYPMSLYESLESNGSVSLKDLFDGKVTLEKGCISNLTIDELIFASCRGGWPESVMLKDSEAKLAIPKDYVNQIVNKDMFSIDNVKRNPQIMKAVLKSYARNISTLSKKTSILKDTNSFFNISEVTLDDYISVLEKLFIVDDLYGWTPNIRSKTAIRSGRKREFVDPSIAVAISGGTVDIYNRDLQAFGFIFETLCIRDLKIYSQALGGELSYYHDNIGTKADCVLHLADGRYALIEFKLGTNEIDKGSKNLNKIESLIKKNNESNKGSKLPLPTLKMIITGTKYGFRKEDDVIVVPIGCLKD